MDNKPAANGKNNNRKTIAPINHIVIEWILHIILIIAIIGFILSPLLLRAEALEAEESEMFLNGTFEIEEDSAWVQEINIMSKRGFVEVSFQFNVSDYGAINVMLLNETDYHVFVDGSVDYTPINEFTNVSTFGNAPYLTYGKYFLIIEPSFISENVTVHYAISYNQSTRIPLDIFRLSFIWLISTFIIFFYIFRRIRQKEKYSWLNPSPFKIVISFLIFFCLCSIPFLPVQSNPVEISNYGSFIHYREIEPATTEFVSLSDWAPTKWYVFKNPDSRFDDVYIYHASYLVPYIFPVLFIFSYLATSFVLKNMKCIAQKRRKNDHEHQP